jgi:hypothetical protein
VGERAPHINFTIEAYVKHETTDLAVVYQETDRLLPYPRNARTHSKRQIQQIADSISVFGFTNPVLTDASRTIVAGHGRVEAAKLLGIKKVPTIRLENLSEDQIRAYILADNKLAEKAGWDNAILAIELQHLTSVDLGKVQAQLEHNRQTQRTSSRTLSPSLLRGLVFDGEGHPFTPSHTLRHGNRYRYYVSQKAIQNPRASHMGHLRLPARELETLVVKSVREVLECPVKLSRCWA